MEIRQLSDWSRDYKSPTICFRIANPKERSWIGPFLLSLNMDRKKAILRAAIIELTGFSILIGLLCIEWFYFNWSHGIYALLGAVVLKFAIAFNFTQTIKRINRDYPKEENSN